MARFRIVWDDRHTMYVDNPAHKGKPLSDYPEEATIPPHLADRLREAEAALGRAERSILRHLKRTKQTDSLMLLLRDPGEEYDA
jgi:hypothetical protein